MSEHAHQWQLVEYEPGAGFFLRASELSGFVACIKCKECGRVTTGLFPDTATTIEDCKGKENRDE